MNTAVLLVSVVLFATMAQAKGSLSPDRMKWLGEVSSSMIGHGWARNSIVKAIVQVANLDGRISSLVAQDNYPKSELLNYIDEAIALVSTGVHSSHQPDSHVFVTPPQSIYIDYLGQLASDEKIVTDQEIAIKLASEFVKYRAKLPDDLVGKLEGEFVVYRARDHARKNQKKLPDDGLLDKEMRFVNQVRGHVRKHHRSLQR